MCDSGAQSCDCDAAFCSPAALQTHLIRDLAPIVATPPRWSPRAALAPLKFGMFAKAPALVPLINGWVGLEAAPNRGRRGRRGRPCGLLGTNEKGHFSFEGCSRALAFTVAVDACH